MNPQACQGSWNSKPWRAAPQAVGREGSKYGIPYFCASHIKKFRTMPARRKQAKPVGPFDLTRRLLPGGTEMEALAAGYALERERKKGYEWGYTTAATEGNTRLLRDTENAYLVTDLRDPHGRLARAMTKKALFNQYGKDLTEVLGAGTYEGKLSHDINRAMGIPRGQSVAEGLPAQFTLRAAEGNLFVTHVKPAQAYLGAQANEQMNRYLTDLGF